MPQIFTALIILSSLFSMAAWHSPIASIIFVEVPVAYQFGEQAVFSATVQSDSPIQEAFFAYQPEGKQVQMQPVDSFSEGKVTYTLNLRQGALRAFSSVSYWFQVKAKNGDDLPSPHYSFFYEDNRFTWQKVENSLFTVHWAEGDLSFAQDVQNAAQSGYNRIRDLIPVNPPAKAIDIYVYAHSADLQSALDLGGIPWVAGSASPDLGVVMVSIAPGTDQLIAMDQQIPHELAHILTYQLTGSGYAKLPVWLTEGIASTAELYPNSDYAYTLNVAKKDNNFISMQELCLPFPRDASRAFLAYAEADSFTRFLQSSYGVSGMKKLIQSYLDGLGCSDGVSAAFGVPLNVLEYRWKQNVLNVDTFGLVVKNLSSYIIPIAVFITGIIIVFLFARQKPAKTAVKN